MYNEIRKMVLCPRIDIRDLTFEELRAKVEAMGERPFRAAQIFDWLYKKRAARFEAVSYTHLTLPTNREV